MAKDAERQTAADPSPPAGGGQRRPAAVPKRRRRWRRILIALALALVVLVALAPYLASTSAGTALISSAANSRLKGQIEIGDLSLSWLGPTRLMDLRIRDTVGREVLKAQRVEWVGGLWRAIFSAEDFGRIDVDVEYAGLFLDEAGELSLAKAFEPKRPRRARRRERLLEPVGQIALQSESVEVVLADGRSIELGPVRTELELSTLDNLTGTLAIATPGGGKLEGRFDVRGLAGGGKVDAASATGSVSLVSTEPLALGPLAAFAGQDGVVGRADLKLQAQFAPAQQSGNLAIRVSDLGAPRLTAAKVEPIDIDLVCRGGYMGDRLTGTATVSGQAGRVRAEFDYRHAGMPKKPNLAALAADLLAGEPVQLPDFELAVDAKLNLAALGRAVPALLKLRHGVEVTAGELAIEKVRLVGGATPAAAGTVRLTDLAARRQQRQILFEPVKLNFDVLAEPGTGLAFRRCELGSEFADLDLAGTPADMKGNFWADLAVLHDRLDELFDLGGVDFGGELSGTMSFARPQRGKISIVVTGQADALEYSRKKTSLSVGTAAFANTAHLLLDDKGKPERFVCEKFAVDVDRSVVAGGGGFYDLGTGGFGVRAKVDELDLAYAGARARSMGANWPDGYAGQVQLAADLARASATAPVISSGTGVISALSAAGRDVLADGSHAEFRWTGGSYDVADKALAVGTVQAWSDLGDLLAQDVRSRLGDPLSLAGKVQFNGDLAKCLAAAAPLAGWKHPPDVTGRLIASARWWTDNGTVRFAGGGKLHSTGTAIEPAIDVTGSGGYDLAAESFAAEVGVVRADLGEIGRQAQRAGLGQFGRYAGLLELSAKVSGSSPDKPLLADGQGSVRQLSVDGKLLGQTGRELTFRFDQVRFGAREKLLEAALVKLDSAAASLAARKLRCRFGQPLSMVGDVTISADLAKCLAAAAPLAKWEQAPDLAGRLAWTGKAGTEGNRITLDGSGAVEDFELTRGGHRVREERIGLTLRADVDTAGRQISLQEAAVKSEMLSATLRGTVNGFGTDAVLDLQGRYQADMDKLTALLHSFRPELAETVSLAGSLDETFAVTGRLYQPRLRPVFRGVGAKARLGWASAELHGVQLGKAVLSPSLTDGRMLLPVAEIPAAGGTARLGCTVDLTGDEPQLRIAGPLQLLEDVPMDIDPNEIDENFLRWISPIFRNRMTCRASVRVEGIDLPLSERIKQSGVGTGRLELKDLQIESKGFLAELLSLGGLKLAGLHKVTTDGMDFRIRDGRIEYDDFTLVFAKAFDMKFEGSVGFDETLDMRVWVPVTPALLERLGLKLKGPIADILSKVRHVQIPIGGTIKKPKLDLSKVDLRSLLPILPGILDDILKPAKPPPTPPSATAPAVEKIQDRLIEGFFDLIEKRVRKNGQK